MDAFTDTITDGADTITDEETPRARLGLLLKHFSELGDDREPWRVMYPLNSPVTKSLFDQSGSGATMMASMVISPLISAMTANASATSV